MSVEKSWVKNALCFSPQADVLKQFCASLVEEAATISVCKEVEDTAEIKTLLVLSGYPAIELTAVTLS